MKHTKGFTLIELLIVIALLGALAIGLLATIDPFEQLKKGRDTSMRNTVSELYNANLRYYATKSNFPWNDGTAAIDLTSGTSVDTLTDTVVQKLIDAGELKSRFVELATTANLNKITLTSTDPAHVVVCFQPESKSFQNDNNTIYNAVGAAQTSGCGSATSTCFYCIQ